MLKNESGVHRLVRLSPFNAKAKRNTSFSLVEVLPKFEKTEFEIPESDLEISFSKSGGAGGQNVNKRETAVRITHIPTGASVYATNERSQEANREAGLKLLQAKVWKIEEEKVLGEFFVQMAYRPESIWLTQKILTKKFLSDVSGWVQNQKFSTSKIDSFIQEYDIEMNQFEDKKYSSFNEFFIRKFKPGVRKFSTDPKTFPAFAEARYLGVDSISSQRTFKVKDAEIDLVTLIQDSDLAKEYQRKIKQLASELNEPANDVLYQVLNMPDVLKSERREPDENEWKEIKTVITEAVESLNSGNAKKAFSKFVEIYK